MAGNHSSDSETDAILTNLEQDVGSLEDMLKSFLERPYGEMIQQMDTATVAKMNVMLAYTLNSLYFAFLRTRGQNPNEHPVKKELDRVKEYYKKVKETSEKSSNPQLKLNVEAANRFIQSALNESQPNKEEKLDSQVENNKKKSVESKGDKKKAKSTSQKETLESNNKKRQKK